VSVALRHIRTSVLDIAFEDSGTADGPPVFLLHGWPYDPVTICAS
jgi:pimeloyl-ACP methyl ester carboxylesterase